MDLVTIFRIGFVVGIVAIPVLYFLFARRAAGREGDRVRSEDERAERELGSERHGGSARATE